MKSRSFKKFLVITALVVLLLALTASMAAASGGGGGSGSYYTVHYGDTLFSIGRMYGVNPYYIAQVNGLPNPNCIYAGQALWIPGGYYDDGGCSSGCYNPIYDGGYRDGGYRDGGYYDGGYRDGGYRDGGYYDGGYGYNRHVVVRGETLTSIAYYYGVSPWALARANGIYDLNRIYVGQVLRIPSGGGGYYGGGGYSY